MPSSAFPESGSVRVRVRVRVHKQVCARDGLACPALAQKRPALGVCSEGPLGPQAPLLCIFPVTAAWVFILYPVVAETETLGGLASVGAKCRPPPGLRLGGTPVVECLRLRAEGSHGHTVSAVERPVPWKVCCPIRACGGWASGLLKCAVRLPILC